MVTAVKNTPVSELNHDSSLLLDVDVVFPLQNLLARLPLKTLIAVAALHASEQIKMASSKNMLILMN